LKIFRDAVDGMIESLEAAMRIAQWNDAEPKPEPLIAAANQLVGRIGVADRLVSSKFMGPAADVTRVEAMQVVLKRLSASYLVYRKQSGAATKGSADLTTATNALELEISGVRAGEDVWR
jgi:hypothetical protein